MDNFYRVVYIFILSSVCYGQYGVTFLGRGSVNGRCLDGSHGRGVCYDDSACVGRGFCFQQYSRRGICCGDETGQFDGSIPGDSVSIVEEGGGRCLDGSPGMGVCYEDSACVGRGFCFQQYSRRGICCGCGGVISGTGRVLSARGTLFSGERMGTDSSIHVDRTIGPLESIGYHHERPLNSLRVIWPGRGFYSDRDAMFRGMTGHGIGPGAGVNFEISGAIGSRRMGPRRNFFYNVAMNHWAGIDPSGGIGYNGARRHPFLIVP